MCSVYMFILTVFELWPHHPFSQVFCLLCICLVSGFGVWVWVFFKLWPWLKIGLCGILFLSIMENDSLIGTMKNMKCCFRKDLANAVTSLRNSCIHQEGILGSTWPWWFLNTTMFGCPYPIFKLLLQLLSFSLLAVSFHYGSQFWNGTRTFSTSQYSTYLIP